MSSVVEIYSQLKRALGESHSDIYNGDLNLVKLAHKLGFVSKDNLAHEAAHHGHVQALEWALQKGCPFDHRFFLSVADVQPAVIDVICRHCELTEDDLQSAITDDMPHLVAQILKKLQRSWTNEMTIRALQAGAWDVLKARHQIDQFMGLSIIERAPKMVEDWIRKCGTPSSFTAHEVAAAGRLDVLKWCFPDAKGCGRKVWEAAYRFRHLDILHWLYQSRSTNPDFKKEDLLRMARTIGRQDLLKIYQA